MPRRPRTSTLLSYYRSLLRAYGPQGWWPARTPFEVIVGAILTQNVAWANVEKAIAALRRAGLLEPRRMHSTPVGRIARLIRPTGFYRQKARKLRTFLDHLRERHRGDLERFLGQRPEALRLELLSISGIGPETADSIVLYVARRPVFVVDAYTRRILARHGVIAAVNRTRRSGASWRSGCHAAPGCTTRPTLCSSGSRRSTVARPCRCAAAARSSRICLPAGPGCRPISGVQPTVPVTSGEADVAWASPIDFKPMFRLA
jgi:endonuclease-3 related protein